MGNTIRLVRLYRQKTKRACTLEKRQKADEVKMLMYTD